MSCLIEIWPTLSINFFLDPPLLENPHTVLAAVSCCPSKPFRSYCWAPPHTVIRYITLVSTTPLATINLVFEVAFLAIFFRPLILPVSCFMTDFFPSLMW